MTALAVRWRAMPPPIGTRWRGPDASLAAIAGATPVASVPTIVGPAGSSSDATVDAVSSATLPRGTPVTISRSTGQFFKAVASWKPSAFAVGLLTADVVAGYLGHAATGRITLADWTPITGTAALSPGQVYFLDVNGGLTVTAPSSPNCVTRLGEAVDASTLLIFPQPPIQL